MSGSPLVDAVEQRLRCAGYRNLKIPLTIASVEFLFTSAMRGVGGRALDLVLLVDTTAGDFGDRNAARVRQRVEGLSRALDVTGSRYVVTVILVGAMLAESVEALSETCRVLHVEGITLTAEGAPADVAATQHLDDRIRVLLPLTLPDAAASSESGGAPALDQLLKQLPADVAAAMIDAVINASEKGEEAVTNAAASVIAGPFAILKGGSR